MNCGVECSVLHNHCDGDCSCYWCLCTDIVEMLKNSILRCCQMHLQCLFIMRDLSWARISHECA
jgi:hypothetical protein